MANGQIGEEASTPLRQEQKQEPKQNASREDGQKGGQQDEGALPTAANVQFLREAGGRG